MLTRAIDVCPFASLPDSPPLRTRLLLRDAPKPPHEKGYPRRWPGEGLDDTYSHSCTVKAARDAKNKGHCYDFCRVVSFWLFFLVLCTLVTSFVVLRSPSPDSYPCFRLERSRGLLQRSLYQVNRCFIVKSHPNHVADLLCSQPRPVASPAFNLEPEPRHHVQPLVNGSKQEMDES